MTRLIRSICLAGAALALGVSMAQAQPQHDRDHRGDRPSQAQRHHGGPPPHAHRPQRPDYRPDHRPGYRPDYRPAPLPYYQGGRGVGPNHNWHRGSRIPPAYRTPLYVDKDWRSPRPSAAPRGHYWVQKGADYLLVAIATGVIAQIIMSR